jgi:hypothetical protein
MFTLESCTLADELAIALPDSIEENPNPAAIAEEFLRKSLLFEAILVVFKLRNL